MNIQQLNNELGNVDLYLLDQILKGRISTKSNILDAGCGEGRNLIYFLNNGFSVKGIDKSIDAIRMLHFIIGSKYPKYDKQHFAVGEIDDLPYPSSTFDYTICSAVLHFAQDTTHFWKMISELNRITSNHGTLFIRMASDIGLKGHTPHGNSQFLLPDGSIRFLLNQQMIQDLKNEFNLTEVEPIKTVVVDNQRSMTTLVLKKIE
ncbi:MAG: class I SAM-dependent methyltransferase [Reichenbachiella sp.]